MAAFKVALVDPSGRRVDIESGALAGIDCQHGLAGPDTLVPIPGPHASAMDRVVAACAAHGIVPGVHSGGGEQARNCAQRGFRMITVASDLASMRSHARAQLRAARATDGDPPG
jgi:hypothetical protein